MSFLGARLNLFAALAAIGFGVGCPCSSLRAEGVPMSVSAFVGKARAGSSDEAMLTGTVTAFMGQHAFFLQDETGGVLVMKDIAARKTSVGDTVQIGGKPRVANGMPYLEANTGFRPAVPRPIPVPLQIDPRKTPTSELNGRLVRFRARVSEGNSSQVTSRAVLLTAFGRTVMAVFEGAEDGSLWPELHPGELVDVAGVLCLQEDSNSSAGFRVVVQNRNAMIWMKGVSWWQRNQGPLLTLAGLCVVAAASIALSRRRKATNAALVPVGPELHDTRSLPLLDPEATSLNRRYQELFHSATDVILAHDLSGKITSFNPAGEKLLGWSAKELVGKSIYDIMAPEETEIAGGLVKTARADLPEPLSFRLTFRTRDGGAVPFEVNSWVEYRDGAPVGVQAICRDISHRVRSEDERIRFERKLQETQKLESLGILAGGIAHDFNNLLTAILGNASLARIELPPNAPVQKSLQEIEIAAERASELCSQMLAYSGQGRFVVARVNLSSLVSETLELIQASVSKRARLEIQLAEQIPAVHGDAAQLRQVLLNLVTNASEALGDGHGSLAIRTSTMTADPAWLAEARLVPESFEGEYVLLEIADAGCGMNPETAGRMFEPFFTTKFTGRGLGLAAVLGIVRSHRGAIKVETRLGQGTKFTIALPAISVPGINLENVPLSEGKPVFNANILVVDDEEAVRRTVSRVLESIGCKVTVAEDGTVALERVRRSARVYDLVLLDLTMPQMDGVQTLRELRRIRPELPVILMSGFAQVQAMGRFNEHRLSGFLQKPFKLEELARLVGTVLVQQQGLFANVRG